MNLHVLHDWDAATCTRFNLVNHHRYPAAIFAAVSRLGDGWFWYALLATMPLVWGLPGLFQAVLMAGSGLACTFTYRWIKGRTRRPRPSEVFQHLRVTVAPLDRFSFPSGHTLHAVAFTCMAGWWHPALLWILAPFTVLVALSRLVLGLHYPSDVLVGAMIGAALAGAALVLGSAFGL